MNSHAPFSVASLPPRPQHNLPVQLTEFVGRAHELDDILQHLHDPNCRLLTLSGLGGAGKTRLALTAAQVLVDAPDAARLIADGVYFVPLAGLDPVGDVEQRLATTIADVLHIPLGGAAPTTQMIHALHDKALLIVLDNFEHLTSATPLISAILQGTRTVTLLVTSRTRLHIRGEHVVSLDGLTLPPAEMVSQPETHIAESLVAYDATDLFLRRARAVAPHISLNRATGRAISDICSLVQGLPLGIELAATWTRLLSCTEIADEIRRNLDFLQTTLPDAPVQQRSLRAVFDHSWRLLSIPEQECLRRLALFHGGFARSAAAAVAGATLPILAVLLDTSLLLVVLVAWR